MLGLLRVETMREFGGEKEIEFTERERVLDKGRGKRERVCVKGLGGEKSVKVRDRCKI